MTLVPDAGADAPPRMSGRPVDPRLIRYARASRSFFAISAAIVLAQTGVIVAFAWVLSQAIVRAIAGEPVAEIWPLVATGAALVLVRAILIADADRTAARGAARVSLQLRAALVAAVERLGPGWLARRNAATLAATAGHGLESLDAYFGRYLPQMVATAIATPILIGAIALSDPISGLIVVLTIPLIPVFMVLIGLATRAVQRSQFRTLGRLAARFSDTVNGLGTLKLFGRQHRAADSIERITRDYKHETMTVLRVSFLSGFALEFLASISVAIVAVTIGLRLLGGEMDFSIGLFVLLLAPEAYLPLRQVGVQFHAAAEGVAATDEIFAVLEADDSRPASSASDRAGALVGDASALLQTRGLRVLRDEELLPPVDLAVHSGQVVLLTGPSGTGKSSAIDALLGFAPYEGWIGVDGRGVADARERMAWAGQRPGLIAGTVQENVTLGDDTPDAALAAAVLVRAQAQDVGPALVLGALGTGLSGGQAHRVAVARALYRLERTSARVLVLDEPSSALDAHTERALWNEVRAVADRGAGVLLVSHRESARAIADRVVHLEPMNSEVLS